MAGDNAQEKSEENSINSAESKSAACSRECLQFEWLDNMSKKLPGVGAAAGAGSLADLTITPDKQAGDAEVSGAKLGVDPVTGKSGADAPGIAAADRTQSAVPDNTPGNNVSDGTAGKSVPDSTPGKAVSDGTPGNTVSDRTSVAGSAASRAGAEQAAGKAGVDKPAEDMSGADTPGPRDLRKEIIHLAEYGHCSFADRNEYRDTLDKVLKEFSEKSDVSDRSKMLQQMVADFLKNPNQESYADFSKQFNKFFIESGKLAMETARQLDAEKAKNMTPERQAAEAESLKKNNELFKELDKLPKDEKERIICLMDWQDEVSRDERNERVRAGMAKYPELLKAFNASEAADGKRDAMRSPREAELAQQHRQQVRDNILARSITALMLHRSRMA
jgi:hypothetical protein